MPIDQDIGDLSRYDLAPIFPAVAYPSAIGWVPRAWIGLEFLTFFIGSILIGAVSGIETGILVGFPVIIGMHVWAALRYRRDPFFLSVLSVRLTGKPVAPISRTRSLRPLPRRRHLFR